MSWLRTIHVKGAGALAFVLLLFAGCTFSDDRPHCSSNMDCGPQRDCFKGFCVQTAANGGAGKGGGGGRAGSPTTTGGRTGSVTNPNMAAGTSGAAGAGGSTTVGRGEAGRGGAGEGGNGTTPTAGTGGPDITCQDGDQRPCALEGPSSGGMPEQCNRGLQVCSDGKFGDCTADSRPLPEACNGLDDDCNGMVDDGLAASGECYPSGMAGCVKIGNTYQCTGVCKIGMQTCVNGVVGGCTGFTGPSTESCANPADENCDGTSDENCACTGTQPRSCYTGTAGTQDKGKCKAGTQTCTNGTLGPCSGQTTPAAESCANEGADDDCDGTEDNIRDRGTPCVVPTNKGPCMLGTQQCQGNNANLVCVTPAGTTEVCNGVVDDDCDGKIDEGFDLMTDEMHCGSCTRACASGETCCGGVCKNTKTDAGFCGGCEASNKCATDEACCNGLCKNTKTDANFCGGCEASNKCATGDSCCDGKCADTTTDELHCGMCPTACTGTDQCCAGKCISLADNMNCGSCNKACSGSVAVDGGTESCMCMLSGTSATCSTMSNMTCP